MKTKQFIFLLLEGALVLASIGVVYFLGFLQVEPTTVYRFTKSMPSNTIITASDIEPVEIPYAAVTPDFALVDEDIIGQALKSEVYPGEYVITKQLKKSDALTAFDSLDLSDKVKVAIPIKDLSQAVGGLLNSGDLVDLYYTGSYEVQNDAATEGSFYSKRFMEEVVVYKVLNETANESTNDIEKGGSTEPVVDPETGEVIGNAGDIAYVVLAVTAEQALEIQTRLQTGSISIIGRFEETTNQSVKDFIIKPGDGVDYGFGTVENEQ